MPRARAERVLALYGHPFSSYTWKALIPLHANETPFAFEMVDPDHPENSAFVAKASPLGKFPVLVDGEAVVFEATAIIEYLDRTHPGPCRMIPADPAVALHTRMMDRVFDNYVMAVMQDAVNEYLRAPGNPDLAVLRRVTATLDRSYRWIDEWLATYPSRDTVTLIECAAAPSLFYADWVHPIAGEFPRLTAWRRHLLALPPVARCVEGARPYRPFFPLGAPERD